MGRKQDIPREGNSTANAKSPKEPSQCMRDGEEKSQQRILEKEMGQGVESLNRPFRRDNEGVTVNKAGDI